MNFHMRKFMGSAVKSLYIRIIISFVDRCNAPLPWTISSQQRFYSRTRQNFLEMVSLIFQHSFSINVWARVIGYNSTGPYSLPPRLRIQRYLEFLESTLLELLENVPLATKRGMWFLRHAVPPNFTLLVPNKSLIPSALNWSRWFCALADAIIGSYTAQFLCIGRSYCTEN